MKKKTAPPAKSNAPLTVRITTTRGPFHQGKPLPLNAVVALPSELAETLTRRGWVEPVADLVPEPAAPPAEAAS